MVKNTKEVLDFLLSVGQASALASQDGELTLSDAVYFWDSLRKIGPAVSGIDEVNKEIASLDDAGRDELLALAESFDIPQDNIEELVKDAIALIIPFVHFLAKCRTE